MSLLAAVALLRATYLESVSIITITVECTVPAVLLLRKMQLSTSILGGLDATIYLATDERNFKTF